MDETKKTVSFRAENGNVISVEDRLSALLERRHGHGLRVCHRPIFAECLYQGLSEESKGRVLLGKRVVDLEVELDGVKVICQDGTVVEGDMVIGADGVRSQVRNCMQRLKLEAEGSETDGPVEKDKTTSDLEKSPYLAGFRLFFGNIPILPGLAKCTNWEGAHEGISTQILTGAKQAWWAVYEQLETPTRDRVRYTEADKAELIEKWGALYMAPGYTLKDVMKYDSGTTGMINLEEGMVGSWTWNRIVLVGDAVRKVEPHAGLGFNQGMTDIVTIANNLYALLKSSDSIPSTKDLEKSFDDYQKERLRTMPTIERLCRRRSRQVAWPDSWYRVYATWILPYFPVAALGLKYVIGPIIANTPVLDWAEESGLPKHAVPYKRHGLNNANNTSKALEGKTYRDLALPLGSMVGLLVGLAAVGWRFQRL